MVQLAMPQLASDMQSSFLHISSMVKNMQEQIRTLQTYNNGMGAQVEQKFADFLSFGLQLFRNGLTTSHQEDAAADQVDIDDVARISEPFTTAINQQIRANNSNASVAPPPYALSRTIVTVTDLWREYSTGLTGCPSVRDLEQQFGAYWRKGNESRYFSRRNEIYKYIKDKAVKERITEEEVAEKLEERRRHIGVSIDKLRKLLKKELSQTRASLICKSCKQEGRCSTSRSKWCLHEQQSNKEVEKISRFTYTHIKFEQNLPAGTSQTLSPACVGIATVYQNHIIE